MATNVTLKRVNNTSGSTDDLHPTTDWSQIESKPSTFTPTSHEHDIDEINGLIESNNFSGTYSPIFYIGVDNRLFTKSGGITFTGSSNTLAVAGDVTVGGNSVATLASPALTGTPTAPTAAANTNSTQIATTAYVQGEITDLIGGAPGALDTLNELAASINDDSSFASTVTTNLAAKLSLSGGTMTSDIKFTDATDIGIENASGNSWYRPEDQYGNTHIEVRSGKGIYVDADTIAFRSQANTDRMRINSSGDVGIGTTSPTQKLDVNGSIRAANDMYAARYYDLNNTSYYTDPASTSVINQLQVGLTGADYLTLVNSNSLQFDRDGTSYIDQKGTGNLAFRFGSNYDIRALLTNDGKLGIGTVSPVSDLHLGNAGAVLRVGPDYPTINSSSDRDFVEIIAHGTDTRVKSINERFHIENTGGSLVLNGSGNNVGIGTDSPDQKLDVDGITRIYQTSQTALKTYSAQAGLQLVGYQSDSGSPYTKTSDIVANADGTVASQMRFFTKASGASSPTERLKIESNGDVKLQNNLIFDDDANNSDYLIDFQEHPDGTYGAFIRYDGSASNALEIGTKNNGTETQALSIDRNTGNADFLQNVSVRGDLILDANNNAEKLYISRYGSTSTEFTSISRGDLITEFHTKNDEETSTIRFKIENTDTETGGGADANNRNIDLISDANNARILVDGSVVWHSGNDGANSSLDADLLDGQHGSYYLDYNNLTNVPSSGGGYTHPTHPGDDISIDTGALTGATVISDLDFNVTSDTEGHITDANATVSTRELTASDIGAAAASHTHGSYDNSGTLSGANVYSQVAVTDGIVTGLTSRTLTAANIGAAASSHNHDGGDITTGTVSSNRLPSGTVIGGPGYSPSANDILYYTSGAGWATSPNYGTWDELKSRTDTAILTSSNSNGATSGTIYAGSDANFAPGDTIMMEVGRSSSVTEVTPDVVIFTLGSADTTPTSITQSIHIKTEYSSSGYPNYVYTAKVSHNADTLYFDDTFVTRYRDTSTASSIIYVYGYTLYVGRIWRLVQS